MTKDEAQKLLDQQLEADPVFRQKYDAYPAKRAAEGKLPDGGLADVIGGVMPAWKRCPACERGYMITLTYGIVWMCEVCHHCEFL